ncbi:MAG: type II toxin-antitoxin system death-on-curing family toxin [Candidatus Nanopelagicales bacterium]
MTDYLSTEDAAQIAELLGQSVRDLGLLASAVARPQASAFGVDAYGSLPEKIAALIDGINRNHPLADGNKRLSWICGVTFANLNGHELATNPTDGERVIIAAAAGDIDLSALAVWVEQHLTLSE